MPQSRNLRLTFGFTEPGAVAVAYSVLQVVRCLAAGTWRAPSVQILFYETEYSQPYPINDGLLPS